MQAEETAQRLCHQVLVHIINIFDTFVFSVLIYLIFFVGKNFCASVEKDLSTTITVFPITFKR